MNKTEIKRILIPTDFSDTSLKAIDHAIFLAKLKNAEVTLLHVMDGTSRQENIAATPLNYAEYVGAVEMLAQRYSALEEKWEEHINTLMAHLVNKIRHEGVNEVNSIIETGDVYVVICEQAKKLNADIIVMGTHGVKGFREFTVGSNTYSVVKHAECPVLSIQKKVPIVAFANILVPFSDKPHSRESVDYAVSIAKDYGATIHLLGIDTEKTEMHFDKIKKEANQIMEIAEKDGIKCTKTVMPASDITELIMKEAKMSNADLIVLVSDMDKMKMSEYFTGPVIQQIVNHSPIPVISIKPQPKHYSPVANYPERVTF
jgi:nucleotide-binding universal stress UspA family protein